MKKNAIYLKYKRERDYARFLKDLKNDTCAVHKVAQVRLARVDLDELMKKLKNQKPSLRVSVPIQHFNNIRSKDTTTKMNNQNKDLNIPALKTKLRHTPTNPIVAAPQGTATGNTVVKNNPIMPNLLPANPIPQIQVETDKPAKAIFIPFEKNNNISLKHKLPMPVIPEKGRYRISDRDVNSANEVKRFLRARVNSSTQTDKVSIVNEENLKILDVVMKSGVTTEDLAKALESFKKAKELKNNKAVAIIDLDDIAHTNDSNLLEQAVYHSDNNKTAILDFANRIRKISSSNHKQPAEAIQPALTSAPTPVDPEVLKFLQMYFTIIKTLPVKNDIIQQILNPQKNKNNENPKTTETDVNYDENEIEMEVMPKTQTIVNQPVIAAPSVIGHTLQQHEMQSEQTQQQNKATNTPQSHSSPIQQLLRRDQLQPKQSHLQQQQLQQQQQLRQQILQQQNMQPQQLQQQIKKHKQPQPMQTPQLKNSQLEHPQIQALQLPHPRLRQPQQHPLDRRMCLRNQRRIFPQQHNQYVSTSNGYPNATVSHVPPQMNSTQQGQFQLYPGDPRIQALQSRMVRARPCPSRLMSTYEANLQTSGSPYPPQHNYWNTNHW